VFLLEAIEEKRLAAIETANAERVLLTIEGDVDDNDELN
jgi:hypothetical protein